MERVNIAIGPLSFDHADYDADNDVLHLHMACPSTSSRSRSTSCCPRRNRPSLSCRYCRPSSWSSRSATRQLISSRIARTSAIGRPFGSGRSQSTYRLPGM
jgi:hypothetical protein